MTQESTEIIINTSKGKKSLPEVIEMLKDPATKSGDARGILGVIVKIDLKIARKIAELIQKQYHFDQKTKTLAAEVRDMKTENEKTAHRIAESLREMNSR